MQRRVVITGLGAIAPNGIGTNQFWKALVEGRSGIDRITRFDASDLMPGKIGAGAFWTGMVDYVGGKDAVTVATEIQQAWDGLN